MYSMWSMWVLCGTIRYSLHSPTGPTCCTCPVAVRTAPKSSSTYYRCPQAGSYAMRTYIGICTLYTPSQASLCCVCIHSVYAYTPTWAPWWMECTPVVQPTVPDSALRDLRVGTWSHRGPLHPQDACMHTVDGI